MLKKENKQRLTTDDFLQFKPQRLDFEWHVDEDGLVKIIVPKFKGRLGKSFCRLIRKGDTFTANMDKVGSFVWKHSDGKTTVKQILEKLKKEFPKEDNIDQRLFLFFQQMKNLDYITY